MLLSIIHIGNSRGIIIPKSILLQLKLESYVDLTIENGKAVLSEPVKATESNDLAGPTMMEFWANQKEADVWSNL